MWFRYILLFYFKYMAQVRKYANGNSINKPILFHHEGIGDYNFDDLNRAYAQQIDDE